VHAVRKYLSDWAEPEIRLASDVAGPYERAVVVPVCREEPEFLDGYVAATQTSRGRTLCIVVVNGAEDAEEHVHAANEALFGALLGKLKRARPVGDGTGAHLGTYPGGTLDVLLVDRASAGRRVPRKEGVGLARKVGTDVALALHAGGRLRSRFVFGTDADAVLPEAHFDVAPDIEERTEVAAIVFPFWHDAAPDAAVTRATAVYELSLRYYVLGLDFARSPYAYPTLGSATAVSAEAYAAVRGYPKREAAEDFYLLNKIAKVGTVARPPGLAVRLRSRTSDRTPFGTGRRVADAIGGDPFDFYSPRCFSILGDFLVLLGAFAEHGDVSRLYSDVGALGEGEAHAIVSVLDELDARSALDAAAREAKTADARRRRVHTWFDAFRTLKVVHALRDRVAPNLPWTEAVRVAPFRPPVLGNAADVLATGPADAALVALRYAFTASEARGPMFLGPVSDAVDRASGAPWATRRPG
jgi:hypothetical protein